MNGTTFLERINRGEMMVSDGAMGTNLQKRGLQRGTTSEAWMFTHTEEIVGLHQEFIDAGSEILLTNTFGASPIRLESADLADQVKEVNLLAVELAREAIGNRQIFIAGSIGPAGQLMKPYGPLDKEAVASSYQLQAEALDFAGVDLIVVETQFDLAEAALAVQSVRSVSKLPLVCSFSFDRGTRTMMGVSPSQMASKIGSLGVDLLGVNCGSSLDENFTALIELRQHSRLPLWFKPNAGKPVLGADGTTHYKLSSQEMGDHASHWVGAGAQVVGGCCGTTPAHLEQIANKLSN